MALKMSRSPVRVARTALKLGKARLEPYSHPSSPQVFTQAQLFAILVLRQFLKTDYRSIIEYLRDSSELREALELKKLPHYSTLCVAHQRFSKKKTLMLSSTKASKSLFKKGCSSPRTEKP